MKKRHDIPIFRSEDELPHRVGILWLTDVEVYKNPDAGVSFRYYFYDRDAEAGVKKTDLEILSEIVGGPHYNFNPVKASTYLYNLGLPSIPKNLESDEMAEIFNHALADIFAVVNQGDYHKFEILQHGVLAVSPQLPNHKWLWVAMRYQQRKNDEGDDVQDRISHLAVRCDGGYINKVRYTYPATLPSKVAYSGFLLFLFEWKHAIDRLLSGKRAIQSTGDYSDKGWDSIVTSLRETALPHPLGFFDQHLAEVKQAELVRHHFHSNKDSPERRLEKHEVQIAVQHEAAHAIFSTLEKEMALELDVGGFGSFYEIKK